MKPLTRRQALQTEAFLAALRRTGNSRLAARELGLNRTSLYKRRRGDAVFAARWEAARAAAHAAFHLAGGPRPPEILFETGRRPARSAAKGPGAQRPQGLRTKGGEPTIVRDKNGRLQLQLARPGQMTRAAEQAFFRALSASANVRLSAAAAGFAHSTFYAKKRVSAQFARDMRIAITIGVDRLEAALTQRALQLFGEGPPWPDGLDDDNPLPKMTVDECIHLVTLHQNRDRMLARIDRAKRWPAPFEETKDGHAARRRAAARARHYEATGDWRLPGEEPPPPLPPLDLVTGWSRADPAKRKHHPERPLFGGWRIGDWKKRKREAGT